MVQKTLSIFVLSMLCLLTWPVSAAPKDDKKQASYQVLKSTLEKLRYHDSAEISDSLRYYLDKAELLCENLDLSTTIITEKHQVAANIYFFIGSAYYNSSLLAEALLFFKKATELYKQLDDKYDLARALNNQAIVYLKIGNQTKALDYLHKSTSIFIDVKDSNGIVLGYNSIAKIYRDQEDLQRTQEYLDKALIVAQKLGDSDVLSSVLNSIAGLTKAMGDQEGALEMYREALSVSKNAKNEMKSALILNNLGVIYKEMGELEEAKIYFDRAYKITVDNNSSFGKVFTMVNLGEYYLLTKNYDKAFKLTNEAFEISSKTANDEGKYKAVNVLVKIFEEQRLWEKMAYYQKILIDYKDKREKQVTEQISQHETIRFKIEKESFISENQEVESKYKLEKETQRLNFIYIIFSIVLVVLITFSSIFYFRLKVSREKNKNITKQSEERKMLLQEVHHRVKNNFQIVSSMLRLQSYKFHNEELRENFEEAVNRINAMAIVHDVIYRQEKFSDIDAKTYLERLVKNLHKTGDCNIMISIDSEEIPFKIETLINLGIALNELITNSFKHAFKDGIAQPKIKISLHVLANKTFELKYKDNGIGLSEGSYTSNFGMELIETIFANFEGEITLAPEKNWNTVIVIIFKEE